MNEWILKIIINQEKYSSTKSKSEENYSQTQGNLLFDLENTEQQYFPLIFYQFKNKDRYC